MPGNRRRAIAHGAPDDPRAARTAEQLAGLGGQPARRRFNPKTLAIALGAWAIAIVFLHGYRYPAHELALECLRSVRKHSEGENYRLIWVDNASPAGSEALRDELAKHRRKIVILNDENLGFVKAANQGLALSRAPYIVLMNNDTEAAPAWIGKLRAPLKGSVGLSGPRTTTPESWQGRHAERATVILPRGRMLAFFAVMMTRQALEKVGYLDEGYGVGLGDDDAYCRSAERAGFRLAFVGDLLIPHKHRSTFRSLYTDAQIADMQKSAMDRFRKGA